MNKDIPYSDLNHNPLHTLHTILLPIHTTAAVTILAVDHAQSLPPRRIPPVAYDKPICACLYM